MAKTVQTLVEVIEARAKINLMKVLNEPFNKHFAALEVYQLLPLLANASMGDGVPKLNITNGSYTMVKSLHSLAVVQNYLIEMHLPSYIEEETKQLLTRIEDLEVRIGEFENVLSYAER